MVFQSVADRDGMVRRPTWTRHCWKLPTPGWIDSGPDTYLIMSPLLPIIERVFTQARVSVFHRTSWLHGSYERVICGFVVLFFPIVWRFSRTIGFFAILVISERRCNDQTKRLCQPPLNIFWSLSLSEFSHLPGYFLRSLLLSQGTPFWYQINIL